MAVLTPEEREILHRAVLDRATLLLWDTMSGLPADLADAKGSVTIAGQDCPNCEYPMVMLSAVQGDRHDVRIYCMECKMVGRPDVIGNNVPVRLEGRYERIKGAFDGIEGRQVDSEGAEG